LEWLLIHSCPGLAPAVLKSYSEETVGGYPRSAWLKWAAFLHDVGKPATGKIIKGRLRFFEHEHVGASLAMRVGQRLRCSRQEVQLLGLWVRNHMRSGNLAAAAHITDKAFSRYFRDLGENGVGMVLVSLADHYTYLAKALWGKRKDPVEKISQKLITSYYENRSKILPERLVDGHELMRKFKLKPGPIIGRLLAEIQDAQVEGKVLTKEDAILFSKRWLKTKN
jgi:putative nucleotidyltransferase with HDIG domain